MHEKTILGNVVPVNCYIFICFLTFGNILLSKVLFIPATFLLFSVSDSYFKSWSPFMYTPTMLLPGLDGILNTSLPLKKPYIYNNFIFRKNILFLISSKNAFSTPLLLAFGNTLFFLGPKFWTNVIEEWQIKMHPLFLFCVFKPWTLTEDLELSCPVFIFSSYSLMVLLRMAYFEQNGSFYMKENQ